MAESKLRWLVNFIGRQFELKQLNKLYEEKMGRLLVIYGRRRIGKSELIHQFINNKKSLYLEGLEHEKTISQIKNLTFQLSVQLNQPHLQKTKFENWSTVFDYLTKNVFKKENGKYIFVLDEFQWLAAGQVKLINQIKVYWDQYWKKQGVMLILCGSIAQFMTKKVIRSKALYGRIDYELHLKGLLPFEVKAFLPHKNHSELTRYMLVMNGVPKYYDLVQKNRSFEQNINSLMFQTGGFFVHEFEKVFYSQFKEHRTYKSIVLKLAEKNLSLEEIAQALKIKSGGSLKSYLENLELADFILSYTSIDKKSRKTKKYKLADEFIIFYLKFIYPHLKEIEQNRQQNLFQRYVKPKWGPWLGFAFELFCQKNSLIIAKKLGFDNYVDKIGPLFSKTKGYQFDLVFYRTDKIISLCEIKYHDQPINTTVINEFSEKLKKFTIPRGYTIEKILISFYGPSDALKDSGYFDHFIDSTDFFDVNTL